MAELSNLNKNKVVLGLSGGVDSTTAALLLKKEGKEVTGLYFDVLGDGNERVRAEKTAEKLGIDFIYRDMSVPFREIVISDFCSQYRKGRTPNPCIVCNPNIKFKVLQEEADKIGAYYIATGHYAKTIYDKERDRWFIGKSLNEKKDQSYMLYRLKRDVISRLLLPLENFSDKTDIRRIAKEHKLENADQKDSQEICFIDENTDYKDYLKETKNGQTEENSGIQPGDFVDINGKKIGTHKGLIYYTVGQRKGLGGTFGKPMFVVRLDGEKNQVVLGDNEDLFSYRVISGDNSFPNSAKIPANLENTKVTAKIRYTPKAVPATIKSLEDGKICTVFDKPVRAVTPGQSIVFYLEDKVIGGGFIL